MTDIFAAAQTLIRTLNAPAQAHSVWIKADTDEYGRATGSQSLCVSIRPTWKDKIKVPEQHEGHTVVNMPWPKGS